jgi:hypothetical protein
MNSNDAHQVQMRDAQCVQMRKALQEANFFESASMARHGSESSKESQGRTRRRQTRRRQTRTRRGYHPTQANTQAQTDSAVFAVSEPRQQQMRHKSKAADLCDLRGDFDQRGLVEALLLQKCNDNRGQQARWLEGKRRYRTTQSSTKHQPKNAMSEKKKLARSGFGARVTAPTQAYPLFRQL